MNRHIRNENGFTLVEMLVVMVIFMGLLLIISYTFEHIIKISGQQIKSAETSTEGIVGLEMLRADLEHSGFGLPWTIPNPPTAGWYNEVTVSPVSGITSSGFNEATPSAFRVGFAPTGTKILNHSGNTNPGSAYLVIKSARVSLDPAAQKWSYVTYAFTPPATNASTIKRWDRPDDDFAEGDRVITLNNSFDTAGTPNKVLAMVDELHYSYPIPAGAPPLAPPSDVYKPSDGSQYIVVYGIVNGTDIRMPYNRADYYIRAPSAGETAKLPSNCNPGTGILFKGEVMQLDGRFTEYPLLNCVADLQVEFELDVSSNGNISYSSTLPATAADVRSQLKVTHVYILAHEGKKDGNYTYPYNSIQVGDAARSSSSGRVLDATAMASLFGTDWKNYRWKVYTIVVKPKNLM